jgi:hypothetical protein
MRSSSGRAIASYAPKGATIREALVESLMHFRRSGPVARRLSAIVTEIVLDTQAREEVCEFFGGVPESHLFRWADDGGPTR